MIRPIAALIPTFTLLLNPVTALAITGANTTGTPTTAQPPLQDTAHCVTARTEVTEAQPPVDILNRVSAPAVAGPTHSLSPGLGYRTFDCRIGTRNVHFNELRLEPGHGMQIRALRNLGAHPDDHCPGQYGGTGIRTVLTQARTSSFEVLGATNGSLYHLSTRPGPHGDPHLGFSPNILLWSEGEGYLGPLNSRRGPKLFVADAQGGHEVLLGFSECGSAVCATIQLPGQSTPSTETFDSAGLIARLRQVYPTMTLALQSNSTLTNGTRNPLTGALTSWSNCPRGRPRDPRCQSSPRTVLCGRGDGSISLIVTPWAFIHELADGLPVGGSCGTACTMAYNLDGGGSTQMARTDGNGGYSMTDVYAEGRAGDPHDRPLEPVSARHHADGCHPYRPVDNYLVFGRTRQP